MAWSRNGRYLAFSLYEDPGSLFIYVWDSKTGLATNITPGNMPANLSRYNASWSHDGRYLGFSSYEDPGSLFIYVWDSKTGLASNIRPDNMPASVSRYNAQWSYDGRLIFTTWADDTLPSEIYFWDGYSTTNLSLNLAGDVQGLTWNTTGEMAILSESDGKYKILVWDGETMNNGDLNDNSLTEVAPGIINYYSFPSWSPQGTLVFLSQTQDDTHAQIYEWDGQTAKNISQNPNLHNGSPRWSPDGRLWAFATFFSSEQLLYVRDENDKTILTTEGYSPAWSSDNTLAYCWRGESIGWDLHLWDGQAINTIAHGVEVYASGKAVRASSVPVVRAACRFSRRNGCYPTD